MTPNTRTLKGQSYCSQRGPNPVWPKGSKSRGFSTMLRIHYAGSIGIKFGFVPFCASEVYFTTSLCGTCRKNRNIFTAPFPTITACFSSGIFSGADVTSNPKCPFSKCYDLMVEPFAVRLREMPYRHGTHTGKVGGKRPSVPGEDDGTPAHGAYPRPLRHPCTQPKRLTGIGAYRLSAWRYIFICRLRDGVVPAAIFISE